jgi:F0F1-type ATP synthase assembly protein I
MADDDRTRGLRLAGVGLEFAAAVAGLSLLGYWIDRHFGTGPWGLLIGAGIGLVGGTYNLIRDALAGPRNGRGGAAGSGAGAREQGAGEDRRGPRPPAGGDG